MTATPPIGWVNFISNHPQAHILQTPTWGRLKATFGWKVLQVQTGECGAQILHRRVFPGVSMAYIPKGPVGSNWEALIPEIDAACRSMRASFVKMEPDLWEDRPHSILPPEGFVASPHCIQPLRTAIVNIEADESAILGAMKQKTRYNVNLALRKGVVVQAISDIRLFYSLMETTGKRDQFNIHSLAYYQMAYDLFHPRGECELLLAKYEDQPLACLMVFAHGKRAWYFYGGSSNLHRDKMPNYLLQWEAMRWAHAVGCTEYDLWGIPDVDEEALEGEFLSRDDGLWGVYRFKRGFGGLVHRSAGPWDRIYTPFLYNLYRLWLRSQKISA